MLILNFIIVLVQVVWTVGVLWWGWYGWKKYNQPSSIAVIIAAVIALVLLGCSLLSLFITRALSLGLSFLLFPLCTWTQWLIHRERRWISYTFLFFGIIGLFYSIFALNVKLSLPLSAWSVSNYVWLCGVVIVGIGFIVVR
jgi:hypothetical protein